MPTSPRYAAPKSLYNGSSRAPTPTFPIVHRRGELRSSVLHPPILHTSQPLRTANGRPYRYAVGKGMAIMVKFTSHFCIKVKILWGIGRKSAVNLSNNNKLWEIIPQNVRNFSILRGFCVCKSMGNVLKWRRMDRYSLIYGYMSVRWAKDDFL